MKKPVKAETTVNPPLLRSGMQNACTYSDTGCVGGSICAADAAAYIPVNTDAKVSTTQKDHPVGWSFCVVETTGTITPISPHFTHYLHLSKNRTAMRFFAFFVFAYTNPKCKFSKNSCTIRVRFYGQGHPLPIGFNTTPICSRRTHCTARGVPSSTHPAQRRRSPSSSSAPWRARSCCQLCPCPM